MSTIEVRWVLSLYFLVSPAPKCERGARLPHGWDPGEEESINKVENSRGCPRAEDDEEHRAPEPGAIQAVGDYVTGGPGLFLYYQSDVGYGGGARRRLFRGGLWGI